ncbi:MAG TPA: ATP-binding protein, partial [Syntrophorhabdaceae bacterium]|nr:ATP-binding protein [Syntrophorhabdaceae bacterium]
MMDDICAHITDITANSKSAGAKNILVSIEKNEKKNKLSLKISDDGKGMDKDTAEKVVDPFFSTKTGRKVGLGIPLLKGT